MSLIGFPQLEPLPSHVPGRTLALRLCYLRGKRALQAKRTPRAIRRNILGLELEQEQVGHNRHRDRAFDSSHVFGDLMLAQCGAPFNSFTSSSAHHRRRDTPTISRAATVSGRLVIRIWGCVGPSLRRRLLTTMVTSPGWRSRTGLA
jgi:hypothetical protein